MAKGSARTGANKIAGYAGVVFLALSVLLILVAWSLVGFVLSWSDLVFLIVFSYVPYKTLRKKENLSTWEWALFIIVSVAWAVVMIAAFVAGFIVAMLAAASA